jgi:small nuclear ribonucleoprotein D3
VVTVELKTGEVYRGSMVECEDNWNCQLDNITFTAKDGKVSQLEHVFIRGSRVRFMIIPDMLKNAPMFKRLEARIRGKGSAIGVGRGRAVAMRARVIICSACFLHDSFTSNLLAFDSLLLLALNSIRENK